MKGQELKQILAGMGVSQSDLAKMLQTSAQNVSNLMHRASIKTTTLEKIAGILGKDISVFFGPNPGKSAEDYEKIIQQLQDENKRLNERIDKLVSIIDKMS